MSGPSLPGVALGLERVLGVLGALGNPQDRLPPVIHVAGTNGKGSLIAYLCAVFLDSGYLVHQFSSPVLERFNEYILLENKEIKDDYIIDILKRIKNNLNDYSITNFEAITLAAFLAFSEKKADVLLLETGMGGRLDATNVVTKPLLTAITPISIDHAEFLGASVAAIAAEKAGIIKPGVPCVVGPQLPEAMRVIEEKARALHSPLWRFGAEWDVEEVGDGFIYSDDNQRLVCPLPNLAGRHQIYNAATAIACLRAASKRLPISAKNIAYGLTHAKWKARLQRLKKGPLVDLLPRGCELWLDGGHNPGAAQVLAQWAATKRDKPLFLVCGMLKNKDAKAFFRSLAPWIQGVCAIGIPHESASYSRADLSAIAASAGIRSASAATPEAAIRSLLSRLKPSSDCRILICGSLYLAGHILGKNS